MLKAIGTAQVVEAPGWTGKNLRNALRNRAFRVSFTRAGSSAVEQGPFKPKVEGSIPSRPIRCKRSFQFHVRLALVGVQTRIFRPITHEEPVSEPFAPSMMA